LNIHESGETIYYARQRLQIKFRTVDSISTRRISSYDLDIEKNINRDLKSNTKLHACNEEHTELITSSRRKLNETEIRERIKQYVNHYVGSDECILNAVRLIFRRASFDIIKDFSGGNIYNIEPSKTKTPDDSAKNPGLSKDGSGLYATLYAIKKRRELYRGSRMLRFIEYNVAIHDTSLSDILRFTQLANESIINIDILNNPFDKQLQIRVDVLGDNEVTVLPLSAMSDGTVKWIALITIIMTNSTIFSIEEPENYLHPLMLREIMSIMRDYVFGERFVLISTHSETLINNASPDEIVICNYKNGKTLAKRVSNAEDLDREIRNTGFGLGYYYMSGSIECE
jgi:AAA15 family ATPase/GTPase